MSFDRDDLVQRAAAGADDLLRDLGLPLQAQPKGLGAEYDFPTDVRVVSSLQLGDLRLKLGAYHTWLAGLVGKTDATLTRFQTAFELRVGIAMDHAARVAERRQLKDTLRAHVIEASDELTRQFEMIQSMQYTLSILQAQDMVYAEQLALLSREQSRRDTDVRGGM